MFNATLRLGYTLYKRLVRPYSRSGRARKNSPSTGIRFPDRPTRSKSLNWLSYPVITQCAKSKLTLCTPNRDMRKMKWASSHDDFTIGECAPRHPLDWSLFGPPIVDLSTLEVTKCLVLSEMEPWFLGFGGGRPVATPPSNTVFLRKCLPQKCTVPGETVMTGTTALHCMYRT